MAQDDINYFLPNQGEPYLEGNKTVFWNFARPTTVNGVITHVPTIESYYDPVNDCSPLQIKEILIHGETYFIAQWEELDTEEDS